MDEPHESDVDYTAANLPDEDTLQDMMESALTLHSLLSGESVSRRPRFTPPQAAPYLTGDTPLLTSLPDTYPRVIRMVWDPVRLHGMSPPPGVEDSPLRVRPLDPVTNPEIPYPVYKKRVMDEAMTTAATLPRTVSTTDAALIADSIVVIRDRSERLRHLGASSDPVLGHALNSIDLGLVGLARVAGGENVSG